MRIRVEWTDVDSPPSDFDWGTFVFESDGGRFETNGCMVDLSLIELIAGAVYLSSRARGEFSWVPISGSETIVLRNDNAKVVDFNGEFLVENLTFLEAIFDLALEFNARFSRVPNSALLEDFEESVVELSASLERARKLQIGHEPF